MSRGVAILITALVACSPEPAATVVPAPIEQTAYVWQRRWTPGVREAVAHPPAQLAGVRVLIAEVSPSAALTMIEPDGPALVAGGRPITLVVRIEGARPIEALSLAPIEHAGAALRAAGANVVGIEVDHDCATARLPDYARWLADHRPAGYRFSITALPTWAASAAVAEVARAVDEVVVQVHAIRAPVIFDANTAWRDLRRFAGVTGGHTSLRVALPTYTVVLGEREVGVDPDVVGAFARRLATEPVPGVGGIAWFRLPVGGDEQTWSPATFARVIAGQRTTARARIELVAQGDQRFDVVVSNPTSEPVDLPPVHVAGDIGDADMVMGYRAAGAGRWAAPRRSLARDERIVIGWIHGKDVRVVD